MKFGRLIPVLILLSIVSLLQADEIPAEVERAIGIYGARQELFSARTMDQPMMRRKSWAPELEALSFDVRHYDLKLLVDISREQISGSVEIELENLEAGLETIVLDADANLRISGVELLSDSRFPMDSPSRLDFSHEENSLLITTPRTLQEGEELKILVSYGGHASREGYGINWEQHGNSKPLIWTMAEPFGARVWWPCQDRPDDKALVDLEVTTDARWIVAGNGLEVSRRELQGSSLATTHWSSRYEMATYLVVMNISDFELSEQEYEASDGSRMPVVLYAFPELASQARVDLAQTPEMISLLASLYGEYPFVDEKYGNCSTTLGGGMEHQTLTTFGADTIGSDFIEWLDVHELGHQWWGDWLTCADWRELWLNEGFATYTEWVWAEHQGQSVLRSYLENSDALGLFFGPVYDNPVPFSNTVYNKGGWVLRMLRHRLGDQVFRTAIRSWRGEFGGGVGLSSELQRIFEEASGEDLGFFFDQWVYGENRPKIVYDWRMVNSGELELEIHQVQSNADPFRFMLDIQALRSGGGAEEKRVEVQALRDQILTIQVEGSISRLRLDPDHQLLAEFSSAEESMVDFGADFPGPLDFGTSYLGSGESIDRIVPIHNAGSAPLRVFGLGFYDPGVSDFSFSLPRNLPITLDPGESVDLQLSFRAVGMGSRDNWLWINTSDPNHGGFSYLKLHARAGFFEAPRIQTSSRVGFGSVPVGALEERNFEVSNLGGETLRVSLSAAGEGLRLAGPAEIALEAGESVRVGLLFEPEGSGIYQGRVILLSNDPQRARMEIPVSGEGVPAPRIQPVPAMVDFGVAPAQEEEEFRINNIGGQALHIRALDFDGPFQLSDVIVLPAEIPAGASLRLPLRLRSDAEAAVEGVLRILSDDPGLPWLSVPLSAVISSPEEIREQSIVAVAHTSGYGGALWKTEVSLLNPGPGDRAVELEFLPETGRGSGGRHLTRTVPAASQISVEDLLESLGSEGVGGLVLRSDDSQVFVHSRTAAWNSEGGSFGQTIDALPRAELMEKGDSGILVGLASGEGFHSNLEILNHGRSPVVVDFQFFDQEGRRLSSMSLRAQGRSFAQRTDVLRDFGRIRGAWALVSSQTEDALFEAFASMVDDSSHDPTSISMQGVDGLGRDFLVPVAASLPGFDYSRWRTSISLVNPGPDDAEISVSFHSGDGSGDVSTGWQLEAGRSIYADDLLPDLLGTGGVGWLQLSSTVALAANLRIFNERDWGSLGQKVEVNRWDPCGGIRLFGGVRSDGNFRSNLGLSSLDGLDRNIEIRVYDGPGGIVGTKTLLLPATGLVQSLEFLKNLFDYHGRAWVEVEAEDPEACFIAHVSVVDGLSGDPSYLPGWRLSSD